MLVLVSYDVSTESEGGRKRLRHVAKICQNHGIRVQFSIFECHIDYAQLQSFRSELLNEIDEERDSLRFYLLGNNFDRKVEHYGVKPSINLSNDTLMI
ncbi:MAG: CRISPR-associated endonuclease Cas2 [Victivallaceae bacterium]|nr:CRISPR-associated endonuclease Cas2 [Victivallaceae bacterium]MDD4180275.1 CRISPR-associated endonuclease Cas2 [Victivallaceae bacterium]